MQRRIIIPQKPIVISGDQCVLVVRDEQTGSSFPIHIGLTEAQSIAVAAAGMESQRPLTHDSWLNSLVMANVMMEKAVVTKLENNVYFAEIYLKINGEEAKMDSRPSDAVALALRFGSPVFIEEELFLKILDDPLTKEILEFIEKSLGFVPE